MMTIRIRVTKPDMNGFCGRDFHPSLEDVGLEGTITNIDLQPPFEYEPTEPNEPLHPMLALTKGDHGAQAFYVILDDGRKVQLMGHEFELLSCVHDGDI